MAAPIDFWFDFSSPYSYLLSEKIDDLAARFGRTVNWHPMLLGVIFKQIGAVPLTEAPVKGEYSKHDFLRSARYLDLPYNPPPVFPVATQHAARAYYALAVDDAAQARRFARRAFRAYFVDRLPIDTLDTVLDLAGAEGADRDALAAATASDAVKNTLRSACTGALALKIFGAPYVIIDGEPFWGADRLPQIERWLARGGF
jgi:2-hydroxychromene-2-carboxylate isomerase